MTTKITFALWGLIIRAIFDVRLRVHVDLHVGRARARAGHEADRASNGDDEARAAAMSDTRMKYGGVPRGGHG